MDSRYNAEIAPTDEAAGPRSSNSPSLVNGEAGVGPPDVAIISTGTAIVKEDAVDTTDVAAHENSKEEEHDNDNDEDGMVSIMPAKMKKPSSAKGSRSNSLYGKPSLMGVGGSYQFMPVQPTVVLLPQVYSKAHTYASATSPQHSDPLSPTNLYIRGLPEDCTDKHLEEMCERFGKIISTKSILDKKTNLCKGYGFVDFERHCDAQAAVQALQASGKLVQFAKLQEQDSTNLYMSNLPKSYTEKNIEALLSPFGTVTSTRILRENGISKGVGFARMSLGESCQKAINTLSGQTLQGASEPLKIKLADLGKKKGWNETLFPHNSLFAVAPSEYVYESPIIAPNGYSGSRLYSQNLVQSPTVHGSHSIGWPYYTHNSGTASSSDLQGLTSHMGHLQINTGASSHHTHYQASSTTATGAPIPPGHTAQYTQQPAGWTISPTNPTHYHIPQ